MSKNRVEAFSDGVFSVAITLLILNVRVPDIANHASLAQYAAAMAPQVPKIISFVLSFAMVAIHWVNHHHFFRHLSSAPLGIVWLNNLLLLWICFLPFPTAMLGEHPTDQFPILLYAVDSLFAALTFYALRSYASRAELFDAAKESHKSMGPRHSLPAIVLFGLAIPLAFVSVYLSLACFLVIPFLYFVPSMIRGTFKQTE